jgi:hypothetical protein
MKAGFSLLKARMALILSAALVAAGAAPALCLGALVGWQIAMRFQTGKWLPLAASGVPVHSAVIWILGLAGLALAALGVLGVIRQSEAIRAHRQKHEDRLRRVQDYLRDAQTADRLDGRREPTISDRRAA